MNSESAKLGILTPLFQDQTITEIMVNHYQKIFVEKSGRIMSTNLKFPDEKSLQALIQGIAVACDRPFGKEHPYFDGYLADGSRVNAVLPPMAPLGAVLTIRRFNHVLHNLANLIKIGSLSEKCAYFLDAAIKARLNIVVSGGTGTGKTTVLNALSSLIPPEERIISIEDISELQLQHPNWVKLEAIQFGPTHVSTKECLVNSLRMRPDRIIVGECRGEECFEMLQAMNTGHEGSLTTIHANSPRDCLSRIESLVATSGVDFPLPALRKQIVSAIDLVIHLKRDRDGLRYVSEILELTGIEQNTITTQSIFIRDKTGTQTTGLVPSVAEHFKECGVNFPHNFFDPKTKVTFYPEPPQQAD